MASEEQLFRQAMVGVAPIKVAGRASIRREPRRPTPSQLARRQAALHGAGELPLELTDYYPFHDPLQGCREGVQEGVYRKLRLGQYQVDARLDLAGMAPARALGELLRFIDDSVRFDVRTALVSHGRGHSDQAPGNRLRSFLALWLPQLKPVLAYHSARPEQGGLAATLLMLAKSERAREANREKQRRSGQ